MQFVSTRGHAPASGLSAALAAGLAPDGGLYLPEHWPHLTPCDFDGLDSLPAIAARLLRSFFEGDPLAPELDAICAEAFDLPAPCQALPVPNTWLLELFHGPTAAFKDFGARFLAACLQRIEAGAATSTSEQAASTALPLTILVATSGDTGAAVGAAFHQRPGVRVCILYPDGRVSPRQAHQLGAFGGNVEAFRVAGTFDDCQALVKRALNDTALAGRVRLSSANSISLGRLLPQMSYYACAALQHWRATGRPLGFVIPTGNLGNALAALLVRRLGLPVGPLHLACNANPTLADFFAGAAFTPRPSVATLANAMDVGAPSNFERLRVLYADDDALRADLSAGSISDDDIRAALRRAPGLWGQVICPHTATALCLLEQRRAAGDTGDYAVVATAHPAKFDTVLAPLLDTLPEPPPALAALLARPASARPLPVDYGALCAALLGDAGLDDEPARTVPHDLEREPGHAPAPAFVPGVSVQRQRPRRWPILLAIAGLSVSLGLQVLLADRDRLAADVRWRPILQAICDRLQCRLPPWREPAAFRVIAREVRPHPEAPDTLQLVASFRNDAAFAQAWPLLQVSFSDIDGQPLAQRNFSPAQYLGGPPAEATIAVGQSVDARLDVRDPGKAAVAFSLDFF